MEEPLTCVGELEALALALETEPEPRAAQQLAYTLEMIRSGKALMLAELTQEEAVRRVADKCWWFVTAARGQGGYIWGGDLTDSTLTPGLSMEDGSLDHFSEAWRDTKARRAAKGGKAGGRQPASKGRGVQRRQGDKRAGKGVGKRLASVIAGGGRRGPSAGAGRSATRNTLRLGARAVRCGGSTAWGPLLALPNGVTLRVLHLTGSGRLWLARKRLLLLRCEGQVGRRGRRS